MWQYFCADINKGFQILCWNR